jgi:multidrug efflux system membrane fusion protein
MNDAVPSSTPPPAKGRIGCFIIVLALLGGGGWWWWNHRGAMDEISFGPPGRSGEGKKGGGKGGRGGFDGPIAVTAEEVKKEAFEEWVNLSGTVTPLNVVTVRSRVDGELQKVHFTEGQMVKAGDLLAEIDPRPFQVALDQAQGALARDQALQDNARADLARYETLLKQDSISKQQVDTQASLVRQYEAAMTSDRAAIASAELQLSYTKIAAPITGRAGLRQIDAGNMIRASDVSGLVIITQMDPMGLVCSIPQERVAAVRKRLAGTEAVSVEAVDKEMNTMLARGRLITTDNQIDLASGTLKLKSELPNPDGSLFPNQFVITRLLVDTQKDATVAPATAIQRGAKGAYVYVLNDDKTASLRNVVTGPTQGDRTLIQDGLKPGEKVITQGVDRLRDGSKVDVIPSGGAPTAPIAEGKPDGPGGGKHGKRDKGLPLP